MDRRFRRSLKRTGDAVVGALALGVLRLFRLLPYDATADAAAWVARHVGPWLPEHAVARAQLAAAFPEKAPHEIARILTGVWDNLGRVGADFAHLDRLWDYDPAHPDAPSRIEFDPASAERFIRLAEDGKPALIFAAHLANWELPAIGGHTYNLDSAVLYRRPNIAALNRWVEETRSASMGQLIATSMDAPVKLAEALARGAHVGMLVDQYYVRGVDVVFFGRKTKANPLIARLARHVDCPIHGTRIIRLPGNRFRVELSEAVAPARDAQGRVDVDRTMQAITDVIEAWVREHPAQWLWLHRRWR